MARQAARHQVVCALALCLAAACSSDDVSDIADSGDTDAVDVVPSDDARDATVQDTADDDLDTVEDAAPDASPADLRASLTAPGPHHIGFRTTEITYTPEETGEPRELRLAVWYPTNQESGPPGEYFELFRDDDVIRDAPILAEGDFPVHVFSHGHLGYAESTAFLMEFFASHGWVVAAPDHTGNTTADFGVDRETEIYFLRARDISAVLDHLYGVPEGHFLHGRLTDDVVLSGHSFGGYTALSLAGAEYAMEDLVGQCDDGSGPTYFCSTMTPEYEAVFRAGVEDARIEAIIPMAAGDFRLFGAEGVAAVDIPVLEMTGELDSSVRNESNGDPLWAGLNGEHDVRVNFVTGGHQTFSDACDLGLGGGDGCGDEFVELDLAFRVIRSYALAFARQHALGDASVSGWYDGSLLTEEERAAVEISLRD